MFLIVLHEGRVGGGEREASANSHHYAMDMDYCGREEISTIKHMSVSKGKCLGICLHTLHMHVHVYIEVCKDR